MEVIDHQPHAWFLLADEERLFLDANCSASFFDYTVLIELDAAEKVALGKKGRGYLDWLAHDVHYTAPAVRGRPARGSPKRSPSRSPDRSA